MTPLIIVEIASSPENLSLLLSRSLRKGTNLNLCALAPRSTNQLWFTVWGPDDPNADDWNRDPLHFMLDAFSTGTTPRLVDTPKQPSRSPHQLTAVCEISFRLLLPFKSGIETVHPCEVDT